MGRADITKRWSSDPWRTPLVVGLQPIDVHVSWRLTRQGGDLGAEFRRVGVEDAGFRSIAGVQGLGAEHRGLGVRI